MVPRRLLSCLPSLLLLLPLSSAAQGASPIRWTLDGPAFSSTPAQLQAAAAAIKPEPDAAVTVLFEQDRFRIAPDGRLTHSHSILYRIETKAALDHWSEVSEDWDPWYQQPPIIKARVLAPGGHVVQLDQKTLTDVPAHNDDNQTYADNRIRKAPLPSLAPGAIVEEETTATDRIPFFSAGNAYRNTFSRAVPVLRSRLIIETPAGQPFHLHAWHLPDTAAHAETADGLLRTTYDLNAIPLYINSDIDLATAERTYPEVDFSTGATWSSVASAYAQLAEPQLDPHRNPAALDALKTLLPVPLPAARQARLEAIVGRLLGLRPYQICLKEKMSVTLRPKKTLGAILVLRLFTSDALLLRAWLQGVRSYSKHP